MDHSKEAIAVDFDGVIHAYREGWKDGSIYDDVIPGSIGSISHLMRLGYPVFILSTRDPHQIVSWWRTSWKKRPFEMVVIPKDQLFWNDSDVVGVTNRKLPATWYIDDRAVEFRSWVQVLNKVRGKDFLEDGRHRF